MFDGTAFLFIDSINSVFSCPFQEIMCMNRSKLHIYSNGLDVVNILYYWKIKTFFFCSINVININIIMFEFDLIHELNRILQKGII